MENSAVSDATLTLVYQRLTPGEQILWAGRPEPIVPLAWNSRLLVLFVKPTLPVFVLALIFGLAVGSKVLYFASPMGMLICSIVILGSKSIRAMPVAHEEYVLTNLRAFSHFQSNGTRILGEMLLDGNTLIQKRRCGQGTTTLVFSRSQNATEPRKVKGLGTARVGFLNLRDAESPLKAAEWSVAINPIFQPPAPATATNVEQAWTRN